MVLCQCPAYTLDNLKQLPLSKFIKMFELAERKEAKDRLNNLAIMRVSYHANNNQYKRYVSQLNEAAEGRVNEEEEDLTDIGFEVEENQDGSGS